ncbi:uncharacterized protein K441DRAFT_566587, partial [Cenococcum geophilum 1.58]|uniref:uncharacterized protein n=1 Tax=Cenococcum geophilum 1.58 TaxID=794803 RepID=UPI00358FD85E
VSITLAAFVVVILFSNIVDPRLGGFYGYIEDKQRQFIALGEQIYAVQYYKVHYRWFIGNKVNKIILIKKT